MIALSQKEKAYFVWLVLVWINLCALVCRVTKPSLCHSTHKWPETSIFIRSFVSSRIGFLPCISRLTLLRALNIYILAMWITLELFPIQVLSVRIHIFHVLNRSLFYLWFQARCIYRHGKLAQRSREDLRKVCKTCSSRCLLRYRNCAMTRQHVSKLLGLQIELYSQKTLPCSGNCSWMFPAICEESKENTEGSRIIFVQVQDKRTEFISACVGCRLCPPGGGQVSFPHGAQAGQTIMHL